MPNYSLQCAEGRYSSVGKPLSLLAFPVEDGSGRDDAVAYVSVAFADAHHGARGNSKWLDYDESVRETALIRATDYLDKRFGRRFRGERREKSQALEWPRLDAFDDDGFLMSDVDIVPRKLQRACAEYALRALIYNVLAPDSPRQSSQTLESGADGVSTTVAAGRVLRLREKVGPIEEDTTYADPATTTNRGSGRSAQSDIVSDWSIPEYPEADMWIDELLRSQNSLRLVRA